VRRPARLIFIALVLVLVVGAGALWTTTPPADDLQQRVARIAKAAHVAVLEPAQVPDLLAHALVSVEDERFYSHHGLDSIGIGRAVFDDLRDRCLCEGGSTITEQLADMAYYAGSGRGRRKLPSMTVALKIELETSKQQILADYLSIVPSGYGLTGAPAASCAFFGHGLASLTVAEAAEIAGMPQAPSVYDPRRNPERARARRSDVLRRMQEEGYIDGGQRADANAAPVLNASPGC
jgi:membrane peptidoglycan carboxypeptidase